LKIFSKDPFLEKFFVLFAVWRRKEKMLFGRLIEDGKQKCISCE